MAFIELSSANIRRIYKDVLADFPSVWVCLHDGTEISIPIATLDRALRVLRGDPYIQEPSYTFD